MRQTMIWILGPAVSAIPDGDLPGVTRAVAETSGEQGGEVVVTRGRNQERSGDWYSAGKIGGNIRRLRP